MTEKVDFEARFIHASKQYRIARAEWKKTWRIEKTARKQMDESRAELTRVEFLAFAAAKGTP